MMMLDQVCGICVSELLTHVHYPLNCSVVYGSIFLSSVAGETICFVGCENWLCLELEIDRSCYFVLKFYKFHIFFSVHSRVSFPFPFYLCFTHEAKMELTS